MPQPAFPKYPLSVATTFSGRQWRPPPILFLNHQPGEALHSRTGTMLATHRRHSASSPIKQPSASNPHKAPSQATRREIPKWGFLPRPDACGDPLPPKEAFLEYRLSGGSTFSARLPLGLFQNHSPGEVIDIQNRLRRSSPPPRTRHFRRPRDRRAASTGSLALHH